MSHLSQRPDVAEVGKAIEHESAALHVTGEALYTDDLVMRTKDVLHAWPVQAPHAKALITRMDVAPAYAVPGVVRVLTARGQRRRGEARRAALPRPGAVLRPCRVLGAR
jgi:xanthine dehydrogenase large subunit